MDLNKINKDELMSLVKKGLEEVDKDHPIQCEPTVKVIADSINEEGKRLTTLQCTFWRAILPELSRHRVFSLSVRSSRAVPTQKLIDEVKEHPWGPREWGENQSGMTASKEINSRYKNITKYLWYSCAELTSSTAKQLNNMKVHKQVVNRLLEPFLCTHVLVSSTEWDNFFKLRISDAAQPEMRDLAVAMKEAMMASFPVTLKEGQWHLPYITEPEVKALPVEQLKLISAARCARISYKTFDGTIDLNKDLELAHKLITMGHWSPLEHQATPKTSSSVYTSNFKGWDQQRQFLENRDE